MGKTKNIRDIGDGRDIENAGELGHIKEAWKVKHLGHVGYAGHAGHIRQVRHIRNAGDRRNVEDMGDKRDNEIAKCNDRVDNVGGQDNQRAIIEDAMDKITNAIDPVDKVLTKVLIHSFSALLSQFSLPLDVSSACNGQSLLSTLLPNVSIANCLDNKFRFFLFSFLLTSLQGLI